MNNIKLMYNSRNILNDIFSCGLFVIILLFPFFKTTAFDSIPFLSPFCNFLLVAEGIFFTLICLVNKQSSKYFKYVLLFGVWNYILAPIISGNNVPSIFYLFGALSSIAIIEIGMRTNSKIFLKSLTTIFTIMIIINYFTMLILPNGFLSDSGSKIYLFGMRTGFTSFIIASILFNVINDIFSERKMSSKTFVCIVFGLLSILNKWVATGIVELASVLILYLIFKNRKKIKPNPVIYCVVILIFNFILIYFGTSSSFMQSLTNIIHRDITLTGRTYIWEACLNKLSTSPICGFGDDSYVNIYGVIKPSHNHWLNYAMEGGYVALAIMIIATLISCKQLNKIKNSKYFTSVFIFFVSILIGCISEIQIYNPFFYMIFELPFVIEVMENKESNYAK